MVVKVTGVSKYNNNFVEGAKSKLIDEKGAKLLCLFHGEVNGTLCEFNGYLLFLLRISSIQYLHQVYDNSIIQYINHTSIQYLHRPIFR